jgi:antitoxin FitA
MSAITIRKLPDGAKQRLRMRAAAHGRSMEAEARDILLSTLDEPRPVDLTWIEGLVELGNEFGGVELDIPAREPDRVPDFSGPEFSDPPDQP